MAPRELLLVNVNKKIVSFKFPQIHSRGSLWCAQYFLGVWYVWYVHLKVHSWQYQSWQWNSLIIWTGAPKAWKRELDLLGEGSWIKGGVVPT